VVAIDGKTGVPGDRSSSLGWKTLCGTREAGKKALVHMVSAWASANNLVLAQRKVDEKSNAITAIPKLLHALELAGTVVTIDAIGCQREIASLIIARKADYVLAVKDNQGLLAEPARDSFLRMNSDSVSEEIDCGHGRVEQRRCSVIADLSMVEKAAEWASLQGLVRVESQRYHKATGKTERETRYYITSLKPDAARLNRVIRQHWGIENKLHWVLDVGFGEDLDRKRAGHGAELLPAQSHSAESAQAEENLQTWNQGKTSQSRLEPPLLAQITGDLIYVGPGVLPNRTSIPGFAARPAMRKRLFPALHRPNGNGGPGPDGECSTNSDPRPCQAARLLHPVYIPASCFCRHGTLWRGTAMNRKSQA
jgi:predicted transposase YbfD/YdcC